MSEITIKPFVLRYSLPEKYLLAQKRETSQEKRVKREILKP